MSTWQFSELEEGKRFVRENETKNGSHCCIFQKIKLINIQGDALTRNAVRCLKNGPEPVTMPDDEPVIIIAE
ncbi:MAG: hypothetical protein PHQ47_03005 [Candidatus Portnoybacteria bacterium]|nr:hypothetical protein [Candidatus Portnoybacteria bacterium]